MAFEVPDLPYPYDALEPHIDEETMHLHHDKHHQAYVDNANKALAGTEWENNSVESVLASLDALPDDIRTAVRNNAGGHANHSLFWEIMGPDGGGEPEGALADAIADTFGSVDELKTLVNDTGVKRFGSGWTWLVWDGTGLAVYSTANQDSPVSQSDVPLLGIDVWEHAYYLNYQNRRPDYLAAWWNVVNWAEVDPPLRGRPMNARRRAEVVWKGDLMSGSGEIVSSGSGALPSLNVNWTSRTEESGGSTSPEELIAAAHASCFSMALSHGLAQAGHAPDQLDVSAVVTFEQVEGGWKIATLRARGAGHRARNGRGRVPGGRRAGKGRLPGVGRAQGQRRDDREGEARLRSDPAQMQVSSYRLPGRAPQSTTSLSTTRLRPTSRSSRRPSSTRRSAEKPASLRSGQRCWSRRSRPRSRACATTASCART